MTLRDTTTVSVRSATKKVLVEGISHLINLSLFFVVLLRSKGDHIAHRQFKSTCGLRTTSLLIPSCTSEAEKRSIPRCQRQAEYLEIGLVMLMCILWAKYSTRKVSDL